MQTAKKHGPHLVTILGVGLLLFLVSGTISWYLCDLRAENARQEILSQQREIQQAWLDKSLDAIRVWRNELIDQARFISSSEMFRVFVMDARTLTSEEIDKLANPDTLHSSDESLRSMAEQLIYMQDLLRDFTRRRAWTDARILFEDHSQLIYPDFSNPLLDSQKELCKEAAATGRPVFGPIRKSANGLVMDMADPLFEVLGSKDQEAIAILLLTVPMEKALASFLARNSEQREVMLPRIVDKEGDSYSMAIYTLSGVVLNPVDENALSHGLENETFMRRQSLGGKHEVYSMGSSPSMPKWLFVLETPAANIDALIHEQKTQIYGIGALASLGIALFGAFVWTSIISRNAERRARELQELNDKIEEQRRLLDSINFSLQAGLLMVDDLDNVREANPAFLNLSGLSPQSEAWQAIEARKKKMQSGERMPDAPPLSDVLPQNSYPQIKEYIAKITLIAKEQAKKVDSTRLAEDISQAREIGLDFPEDSHGNIIYPIKSASGELSIPKKAPDGSNQDRLYRVNFFPYIDRSGERERQGAGCVATFQDITEFRRKAQERAKLAKEKAEREEITISALGRAIESLDENLVGHSDRMADLALKLATELNMSDPEKETLRIAARLSQVGKLFVPRELLTKKDKLSPEELKEVKKAPEHAVRVLKEMHFNLPVAQTVQEMGERIDSSPDGKETISATGRALALVNAFIAMTSSRAWRSGGAMNYQDAVARLKNDPGFDQNMVSALERIFSK